MTNLSEQVAQGHGITVPADFLPLLEDFDKLESLFKTVGLTTLGLDSNVLNEYRYFARALVDMLKLGAPGAADSAELDSDFYTARARAETAYSAALCDTIDNLHMHVQGSLKRISQEYPAFDMVPLLGDDFFKSVRAALGWVEAEIARSREDRSARKAIYQGIATSTQLTKVIELARALPWLNAAAPGSLNSESWLEKILNGIQNEEFSLHYQPKRCVEKNTVMGAEGLMRWVKTKTNSHISIPPGLFIAKAEETGAIHMLGELVLEEACKTLGRWKDLPVFCDFSLSINVSPIQLIDPDFASKLKIKLETYKVPPKKLELEITEDVLIRDKKSAARHLEELKDLCTFTIDDFGKGSTEFQYLAEFPISTIKIDRSILVDALRTTECCDSSDINRYKKLIFGIAGLAKSIDTNVVLEGVEIDRALKLAKEAGITTYQGFINDGYPVSLQEFENLFCQ